MSGLPDGWAETALENLVRKDGFMCDGDWVESKDQDPNGKVRLIQLADIGDGNFINKSSRFMSPEKVKALNCTLLKEGDVLISRLGDPLGKACIFPGVGQDAVTVVDVHILRTDFNLIDNRYLTYFINAPQTREIIASLSSGTTRRRITGKKVKSLNFPVLPVNEQKRIAEKLDQVLEEVNSTKARLGKIPTILKNFRLSVLQSAVNGELSKNWRSERGEVESLRLDELREVKKKLINEKSIKKDLLFSEIKPEECPTLNIPNDWEWIDIASLSSKVTDGEHKTPRRTDGGYYLLSARNVRNNKIDLTKVDYVNKEEFSKLRKRCDPDRGDILISCSGSVGRICIVDKNDEYVMVRSAAMVRLLDGFSNNKYICFALQSPILQRQIEERSKATAQSNLFLGEIKQLKIPFPSLMEQDHIVEKVENLFTFADQIEGNYNLAKDQVDKITGSVLAKAYRGELVPQDPSDEAASVLLERIKTEKLEAYSKPKQKIKKKQSIVVEVPPAKLAMEAYTPEVIIMPKLTKETMLKEIKNISNDVFSFEDLKRNFSADYNSLKDILFELLDDPQSGITQIFDEKQKEILFLRGLK
jgi:type I restriction enzyme, S subunit